MLPPKHVFIMPYPQDFVDTVSVSIPASYYDADYVTVLDNVPSQCLQVLKKEPDFDIAVHYKKGVMFDLLKQVCGCSFPDTTNVVFDDKTKELKTSQRKGKTFKPKPQFYNYFAYTAHALLHGDVSALNWKTPYTGNIQGQDVLYAINKYGVYGLTEPVDSKKLMVGKFAALYARMFNADPRFQVQAAEPLELKTEERLSPLTYCRDCGTIRKAWDVEQKGYTPGDAEYGELLTKFKEQIMKKEYEKHTAEDQERYMQKRGTLLHLDTLSDEMCA